MIYWELFISFLKVGLFSVGGGYAAMPLIQSQAVDTFHWISANEFTNLITIAEMTPGPIAVNSATFIGIRMAGLPGAIIATLGCILPSCFIVSLLFYLYYKYQGVSIVGSVLGNLRPAVVALILFAGLKILMLVVFGISDISFKALTQSFDIKYINYVGIGLFLAAFFVLRKFKPNPILVMVACGVIGLCLYPFINTECAMP